MEFEEALFRLIENGGLSLESIFSGMFFSFCAGAAAIGWAVSVFLDVGCILWRGMKRAYHVISDKVRSRRSSH